MAYKIYKPSPDKVLFSLDTFTWGLEILTRVDDDSNFVEMDKDTALYYEECYKQVVEDAKNKYKDDPEQAISEIPKPMSLRSSKIENPTREDYINHKISQAKSEYINNMINNGFSINKVSFEIKN